MFGWLGPKASDLKGTISLDLISIIFGDGGSSRLYQNLIEKQPEQIFNMVNSEHYQFKDGNNFFIQANFKPEKKEEALNLLKKNWQIFLIILSQKQNFKKLKRKLNHALHMQQKQYPKSEKLSDTIQQSAMI